MALPVEHPLGWLGAVGQTLPEQPAPLPTNNCNGTKRTLSVIEKVMIAGVFLNGISLWWQISRSMEKK